MRVILSWFRLRFLAFATFLVWRLRIGACGVGTCGFWCLWQLPKVGNVKNLCFTLNLGFSELSKGAIRVRWRQRSREILLHQTEIQIPSRKSREKQSSSRKRAGRSLLRWELRHSLPSIRLEGFEPQTEARSDRSCGLATPSPTFNISCKLIMALSYEALSKRCARQGHIGWYRGRIFLWFLLVAVVFI